jgi:hypothetical protein
VRIVVVTGMSGSGKSTALKALEDAGFYAIDNAPIQLLDLVVHGSGGELEKLALGIDARVHGGRTATVTTGDLNSMRRMASSSGASRRRAGAIRSRRPARSRTASRSNACCSIRCVAWRAGRSTPAHSRRTS